MWSNFIWKTDKDWPVQDTVLPCQRKGEDALQAMLLLGIRPPVRRLASAAMMKFIEMGDSISIYSRASSLQGWLSDKADVRKSDPASCIGRIVNSNIFCN